MTEKFQQDVYQTAIENLKKSEVQANQIQKALENTLLKTSLTEEQKEWLLNHRDYLDSLDVVTMEAKEKPVATPLEFENLEAALKAWKKELSTQMSFLGEVLQELQVLLASEHFENTHLTAGTARRLVASIKDIITANRLEDKETSEYLPKLLPLAAGKIGGTKTFSKEAAEKKGFLARLFGK